MILVDTSAWIEWLIGSPTGEKTAEYLPEQVDWLVPSIVQLELAKWLTREVGGDKADHVIALTQVCVVVPLDTETALAAAEACQEHRLATADAIIFATARAQGQDPERNAVLSESVTAKPLCAEPCGGSLCPEEKLRTVRIRFWGQGWASGNSSKQWRGIGYVIWMVRRSSIAKCWPRIPTTPVRSPTWGMSCTVRAKGRRPSGSIVERWLRVERQRRMLV